MASNIPGSDYIGRGFNLLAPGALSFGTPVADVLRPQLYTLDFSNQQTYQNFKGGIFDYSGHDYIVPAGVDLVSTPSQYSGSFAQATNYTRLSEYTEALSVDLGVTGRYGFYSGSIQGGYQAAMQQDQSKSIATQCGGATFFSMLLEPQVTAPPVATNFSTALDGLPSSFSPAQATQFQDFFKTWGCHVIAGVQVGFLVQLFTQVTKTSTLSSDSIQIAVSAGYASMMSGSATTDWGTNSSTFVQDSTRTASAVGGDPSIAPLLVSADQCGQALQSWVASVKDNPGLVKISLTGIWNLAPAAKQQAIKDAFDYFAIPLCATPLLTADWEHSYQADTYFTQLLRGPDGALTDGNGWPGGLQGAPTPLCYAFLGDTSGVPETVTTTGAQLVSEFYPSAADPDTAVYWPGTNPIDSFLDSSNGTFITMTQAGDFAHVQELFFDGRGGEWNSHVGSYEPALYFGGTQPAGSTSLGFVFDTSLDQDPFGS